ncbi:MAG: 1-acyl-sn-glycerol-3-phosphate acyltransferase [Lachnospiraceae bacterium]|nr:1-acyl-sn-glycerol-3-phosphate acyltransferase [Lachnospiraceae bacterium]
MLRFYCLIIFSIFLVIYYILKGNYYVAHEEKYDEIKRYSLALDIIHDIKKRGRIKTVAYGVDNLPSEGGYIMYANHQGKYDALGIMDAHTGPCSVVMDAERSKMPLADQVVSLVKGIRLDRSDFRQQVKVLNQMTEEAKEGRKFIYFPEGGYEHNGNRLQDFRAGAFKVAKNAEVPIIPVALYDSHLPFDYNSYRRVTTQVCFLEPISFEEYGEMSTKEISELVKNRIEDKLEELEQNRKNNGWNLWVPKYRNC